MGSVYISSESSSSAITRLKQDLKTLDYLELNTRDLQDWWQGHLQDIQKCSVFIAALSPDYLDSQRCMIEYDYAQKLNKPILPILVERINFNLLPPTIAIIQIIDYLRPKQSARQALQKALVGLPANVPLPNPLPPAPVLQRTRMDELYRSVNPYITPLLSLDEQMSIVLELKQLLESDQLNVHARKYLEVMQRRKDLADPIARTIRQLLLTKAPTKEGFGRRVSTPRQRYIALVWLIAAAFFLGLFLTAAFFSDVVYGSINGPSFLIGSLLTGLCLIAAKELPYILRTRLRNWNLWARQGLVIILSGFPLLLVLLNMAPNSNADVATLFLLPTFVLVISFGLETYVNDNRLFSILSGVVGILLYMMLLARLNMSPFRSISKLLQGETLGVGAIMLFLFNLFFSGAHYNFLRRW